MRLRLLVVGLGLIVIWFGYRQLHDPRMSPTATARALQARLHTSYAFACERQENDGSIQMGDVDYVCEAVGGISASYWVGTDRHRITEIQSMF